MEEGGRDLVGEEEGGGVKGQGGGGIQDCGCGVEGEKRRLREAFGVVW